MQSSTTNDVNSFAQPSTSLVSKSNKYRMRLCDASPELLKLIKDSEKEYEKPLSNKSTSSSVDVNHSNILCGVPPNNIRKSPYSRRSGNSNQLDKKSRRRWYESIVTDKNLHLLNISIYELWKMIELLKLDKSILKKITPKVNWSSEPRSIIQFPYYDYLHPKEACVATTLRLTPFQYLLAKYILISSARTAMEKSLPFRRCDAQKLLRIDVNKTNKLWEWFVQTKWIQNYEHNY
ncbi:unnamed protein product [Rhizophagus irregularis]|uniref:Uncharacterized protein n=1 Tax=Rhizophagus irregularis TaxID=588596 RepID=A0A2I1EMQ4_9GLOM|nr:hypothetical protein RhiirB3_505730 [Rhizophagus irregularis]CAB5356422.1 unnamed protein product [Rhizophagus irregularis]